MNIAVQVSYDKYLVFTAESIGSVIEGLESAVLMQERHSGGRTYYIPTVASGDESAGTLEFKILPADSFQAPETLEKTLVSRVEDAQKLWLEYYNKYTKATERITQLENEITRIGLVIPPAKA